MLSDRPEPSWWRSFEARLLLGALALRLLYLATILGNPYFTVPITDEAMYDTWARALAAGTDHAPRYPYFDPPLHAYFLAAIYWLFGPSPLAVRLVQVMIGTVNVAVLYRTSLRLFDVRAARIAGTLAALYVPFWYYEGLLLKESFALFLLDSLLLLALGAAARPRAVAFCSAGIVLGLLSLSRVNALALIPACLSYFWIRKLPMPKATVFFLLGLVLAVAPVTARNYLAGGEFVPISVYGGQLLYNGNNPFNTTGDYHHIPGIRPNPAFERVDFHRRAEQEIGRPMTPTEVSVFWLRKSVDFMLEHPLAELRMIGWRLLRFVNYQELPDNHSFEQFKRFSFLLRLPFPGYWLVAPLALIGIVLLRRSWRDVSPLYLFAGCYLLSLLPFWIVSRYRLPIVGVLILLAAGGLTALVELARSLAASPDYRRIGTVALGCAALCALCWLPLPSPSLSHPERNLAYAYELNREYDEAIAIYERLRKTEQNPLNELFLANALGEAGRTKEALDLLRPLQLPGHPPEIRRMAFNFHGNMALKNRKWTHAERAYRAAISLDHTDYEAWQGLVVALTAQQRFDEAEEALTQTIRISPDADPARLDRANLRQHLQELQRSLTDPPAPRAE